MKRVIRHPYYDREGNSISLMDWADKFSSTAYSTIEKTQVGPYLISTVWLGLNHAFDDGLEIFETMIFKIPGFEESFSYQERYSTEEQARAGHALAVKLVETGVLKEEETDLDSQSEESVPSM